MGSFAATPQIQGAVRVPFDQPTIQAAIDASNDGDTILVSPGTYYENLTLSDKTVTLASEFLTTGDEQLIGLTIIDGGGETVITVEESVGSATTIQGFTIRNGEDGISVYGRVNILNNHIVDQKDGIDFEAGGGVVRDNLVEYNRDDGLDLDGAVEVLVEGNTFHKNAQDGIEIRLHPYRGSTLNVTIRGNVISGNGQDGIQLIDYAGLSSRFYLIEGNVFENNGIVGLGLMDNRETQEDLRAAAIPELIHVLSNRFINNPNGISGGYNLVATNNLFVNTSNIAVKNVNGKSVVSHNRFINNGTDYVESNVSLTTSVFADWLLGDQLWSQAGNPSIGEGPMWVNENGQSVSNGTSELFIGLLPICRSK